MEKTFPTFTMPPQSKSPFGQYQSQFSGRVCYTFSDLIFNLIAGCKDNKCKGYKAFMVADNVYKIYNKVGSTYKLMLLGTLDCTGKSPEFRIKISGNNIKNLEKVYHGLKHNEVNVIGIVTNVSTSSSIIFDELQSKVSDNVTCYSRLFAKKIDTTLADETRFPEVYEVKSKSSC